METLTKILQKAKQRAEENNLPYAGALTPQEAQQVLDLTKSARLVDVRSRAEMELVGRIPQATSIEWAFYPGWEPNQDFAAHLEMQLDRESLVMFICRTGGRSHNAAALANKLGFTEAYNVLEGFEGAADPVTKQRGNINGWKVASLPWTHG
ncbi:rhodanese [Methylovorus sp. MM2]|uniref:rhodanese-like domain-containing protein n=1 Tax=Methylovorus sp. MM2 TaxID=1848038 RepID=UPI0007E158A9|nr:rhodanese-like domain-containing protein [Methylovorus sp. MM2]OAM52192.1 rhodanese [Methylovorus sp. MM2]